MPGGNAADYNASRIIAYKANLNQINPALVPGPTNGPFAGVYNFRI